MKKISLEVQQNLVPQGTNHVILVDVSGSMYSTLPKMRSHLKNRMALLVKENDTVSIIYFSGKNQAGVVFENQPIKTLADLSNVNASIDRWLTTIGLTAFVDPMILAKKTVTNIKNSNMNSLSFLTDGYDNCYSEKDILKEASSLTSYFDMITIFEYGWYCNRELLNKIALQTGAIHVFSEDYACLEPSIETTLSSETRLMREIKCDDGIESCVYLSSSNELAIAKVVNNIARIPDNISEIYEMPKSVSEKDVKGLDTNTLLFSLYYYLSTNVSKSVWCCLREIMSQDLYSQYQNCFTKQDYSNLVAEIKQYIIGTKVIDRSTLSDVDKPSVVEILELLSSGENYLDVSHPLFKYNRIGRSTTQKEDTVVQDLASQMQSVSDIDSMKNLALQIADHDTFNPVFVSCDDGLKSMTALVYNESRPNISIRCSEKGYVDIPVSKQKEWGLPESIETYITRNYTVVKDGIVNTVVLPVSLDEMTFKSLQTIGYIDQSVKYTTDTQCIDLSKTPLLTIKDVYDRDFTEYANKCIRLQDLKAAQKVIKHYRDQMVDTRVANKFAEYGDEAAKWLYEVGLRDYGFTPPVSQDSSSGDFYLSKELSVKIKSLSSLPSINAVIKKMAEGKNLNIADSLIEKWLTEFKFISADEIEVKSKEVIKYVRETQNDLNKIMYSILVGKSWFENCEHGDASTIITYNGYKTEVRVSIEEKEIKL